MKKLLILLLLFLLLGMAIIAVLGWQRSDQELAAEREQTRVLQEKVAMLEGDTMEQRDRIALLARTATQIGPLFPLTAVGEWQTYRHRNQAFSLSYPGVLIADESGYARLQNYDPGDEDSYILKEQQYRLEIWISTRTGESDTCFLRHPDGFAATVDGRIAIRKEESSVSAESGGTRIILCVEDGNTILSFAATDADPEGALVSAILDTLTFE